MISCIVLAAGLSSRFGSPKALARLDNGSTILEHVQQNLLQTSLTEIIVVLGASADLIQPLLLKHSRIRFVYNKEYNFGQTSSFKAGVKQAGKSVRGMMLLPVDYPAVRIETFNELVKIFQEQSPRILVPTFKNQKGHPPIFSSALKEEILSLDNAVGVNTILRRHACVPKDRTPVCRHIHEICLHHVDDEGVIAAFNTPKEFESVKGILKKSGV